jgi:hypothetical protein
MTGVIQGARGIRLSHAPASRPKAFWILPVLAVAGMVVSCTSVARVTNLSDGACQASFETQMQATLAGQGETPENAASLAHRAVTILTLGDLGPRPFLVASPSGTDYSFLVEKAKSGCILRLYGRQKGFVSYTNNLTFIDSRTLTGCACAE